MALAEQADPFGSKYTYHRASFTGTAGEYFGIWIVNILLTIVTFGIYSAWAKVRRNRYFYGNTVMLGETFEYHARGKQILIGRLIVFGFFAALNILTHVAPLLVLILWLVMAIALPWMMMRSLRFNARVTSYRNVRFDFVGTYGGACKALYLGGLITVISLGFLSPFATRWFHRYIFNNLRYGDRPFSTEPRLGAIYKVFAVAVAIGVIGVLILGFVFATIAFEAVGPADSKTASAAAGYAGLVATLIIYLLVGLYYRAAIRNIIWSAAMVDGRHALWSDLGRRRYAWIAISNVVISIITLGLMRPWAAVRLQRYVVQHTAINIDGDIGLVTDQIRSIGGVISAEYFDADGFDFGF
ncbi:MAG: DUF898 domain-containing protein [Rhizobiaceae bacterium]|nr:DUF898 domain-containing protein [Rhizobiaceae bacterium]